ncbi:MAG: NifB/NifX family molybdenum-iron cluster-binding protein [Bacteroidales bacterium]|nr:NifB/NifX family molybdenum-iron cluster-binding protein [Bacteroidales bacterium]MCF8327774.1 NifB/NifX family molybdenum-iron cluster-binding protein [Bacteroidales bacterium]
MKKVAVPTIDGNLCTHFGHCQKFAVITIDNNQIIEEIMVIPPRHEPGVYPRWLKDQGVSEVITGGLGQKAKAIFDQNDIKVHIGVNSKPPREAVEELLEGQLSTGDNQCGH